MSTDLLQRKLAKVFASFDVDQDGVIDELDITAMAQIWCDVYEVAPNSAEWRQIHGRAHAMWREMRGSTGADGIKRVTLSEWVEWGTKPDFPDFVENAAIPFSLAVFDVADKDRDGKITMPEMMAAQSKSGMSPEETQSAFDTLDTDRDGYVTGEQYAQAAREFYLSDDPNAPGNLIAGDL
ncbi:EF-hand domain-containing protein [Haloechinothrix salitolerans]|uniref:EF-hand domain-containing protein n=1 Tax=Haloechinothrix salitolerans TaxID=926830 RepID=A0ABW2BWS1_9PSEU